MAREPVIEGIDLSDLTAIFASECFADVEDPLAWVLCSIEHSDEHKKGKLRLAASGEGGLDELEAYLGDTEVQFGAFRVAAVERKGVKLRCARARRGGARGAKAPACACDAPFRTFPHLPPFPASAPSW